MKLGHQPGENGSWELEYWYIRDSEWLECSNRNTVYVLLAQSCPTLRDPMDCSLVGSSVHGVFQARILEWVVISFSRGSSWPRNWTCVSHVSCIAGRLFITEHQGSPNSTHNLSRLKSHEIYVVLWFSDLSLYFSSFIVHLYSTHVIFPLFYRGEPSL